MEKLRTFIEEDLSGKFVVVIFIITNAIYGIMVLVTIPGTMDYADGMKLLDMMPLGYDTNYIEKLFAALGQEGRYSYLYRQIPLDMIYPFCFATCYSLVIGYLFNRIDRMDSSLFYLTLLPIFAGLADYLENLGIIFLLKTYPNMSTPVMEATNFFSMVKSLATTAFFLVLVIILILFVLRLARKTQR